MAAWKDRDNSTEVDALRVAAGVWLKERREAAGLTQRELANALQFDYYTFISQLENGRGKIPPAKYRDWAQALGMDERVFVKKLLSFYNPVTYKMLFGEELLAREMGLVD